MKYSENALNVMAARMHKGIGRAWIVKNLSTPQSAEAIVKLLNTSSKQSEEITLDDFNKKKERLRAILERSEGHIDGVVAIGDADFPLHRGNVKNSERPVFLFYKGDLSLLSKGSNTIAVIGLLTPDEEIEKIERLLVSSLVENQAVIVSGLALGCDSIAHKQTLESKGKTVAILPSPLNDITPAKNSTLAQNIIANGGLLISEYLTPPKSKMELSGRYQERDRLQALFSNAIVLSASYAKNDLGNDSGSRLAMGYAKDYSIPRAVIYDEESDSNNPMYDLNRQIIREDPSVIIFNRQNSASVVSRIIQLNKGTARPDMQSSLI